MKVVGFIGLGNMGLPMALNLSKKSIHVKAYDLSDEAKEKALDAGLNVLNSIHDVLIDIDALVTMLPNDSAVEDVFLRNGVLDSLEKTTLIIDSSTISPNTSKKVVDEAYNKGLSMVDAPVSGGVRGAEEGTLSFIVGGNEQDVKKGSILFDVMGDNTFYAGNSGSGQIAKLCTTCCLQYTCAELQKL